MSSETPIQDQQLAMLLENTRATNFGNLLIALLAYWVLQAGFPQATMINAWFYCMVVVVWVRIVLGYQRQRLYAHSSSTTYLQRYVFITFLIGLTWGTLPIVQYFSSEPGTKSFVFVVVAGIVAASVASLSVWLPALLYFVLPAMLGQILALLLQADYLSYVMALGFSLYTGVIIFVGKNIATNTCDLLHLQDQNQALIDSLNGEIDQRKQVQKALEDQQLQLEDIVASRTQELVVTNKNLQKEIDERRQIEENLQYIAHHDSLTSLPNRSLLVDRLKHALNIALRENTQLAVLFMDLDRFKYINDTLGHSIGDSLLLEVSDRLKNVLRQSDTVARNGGDEFVIILERISQIEAISVAARKIIDKLTSTFRIAGHNIHIGVSVGISLYPSDGDDPVTLLKNADTAMYRAKKTGGENFQFYSEDMSQIMRERLNMESHLRTAPDKGELYMVYQPQVDIKTGHTIGFEALMRWNNPDLGVVSPACFVPILEDTHLIYPVGEWLVENVIQFIKSGKAGTTKVSVNLSALQCRKIEYAYFIRQTIEKSGIYPGQLEFELTESTLVDDFEHINRFLSELHGMGCTVALDDFGTGYTSMSYLTQMPIDIIKIDRSFVRDIETNDNLRSIVKAIITMSQSLGVNNVIEGIETDKQLAIVEELGAHVIQGFLFSKPLEVNEIETWLGRRKEQTPRKYKT